MIATRGLSKASKTIENALRYRNKAIILYTDVDSLWSLLIKNVKGL